VNLSDERANGPRFIQARNYDCDLFRPTHWLPKAKAKCAARKQVRREGFVADALWLFDVCQAMTIQLSFYPTR
jgi:hypothetical protein